MVSRTSHDLVAEVLGYHKPRQPIRKRPIKPRKDQEKRYGTYFPSKASFETKWNFADEESTWEFSSPAGPYPGSKSTTTCDSSSSESSSASTPAQNIVLRYRAGLPPLLRSPSCSSGSSNSSSSSSDSDASYTTAPPDMDWTVSSEESSSTSDVPGLKPVYRKSRYYALAHTLQEAMSLMERDGKNENDTLVCPRPGCRDALGGVKALMYHLHIHNIHDQSINCNACDQAFDNEGQLETHPCRPTASLKPLKDRFRRVFRKLGRNNLVKFR